VAPNCLKILKALAEGSLELSADSLELFTAEDWKWKREASSHPVQALGVIVTKSQGPLQRKSDERVLMAGSPFEIELADITGKMCWWTGREEKNCGASQWCGQGALFHISLNCRCWNTQVSPPCTGCFGSQVYSPLLPWTPLLVLRGQNYVPVIKLQPCRVSLPKGSVYSDDRAALEVTEMSHSIHRGFSEDAW